MWWGLGGLCLPSVYYAQIVYGTTEKNEAIKYKLIYGYHQLPIISFPANKQTNLFQFRMKSDLRTLNFKPGIISVT